VILQQDFQILSTGREGGGRGGEGGGEGKRVKRDRGQVKLTRLKVLSRQRDCISRRSISVMLSG
jgi:hypothetical protein